MLLTGIITSYLTLRLVVHLSEKGRAQGPLTIRVSQIDAWALSPGFVGTAVLK